MATISELFRDSVIHKRFGETHNIKRVKMGEVDLSKLGENDTYLRGDGMTYLFILTEKQ